MSEIYGDDLTPDAGTTLRKMLKKNLEEHMTEFEAISGAASKVQYNLFHVLLKKIFFRFRETYQCR